MFNRKKKPNSYPETENYGWISIENLDTITKHGTAYMGGLKIQIAEDGKVWLSINGTPFFHFEPQPSLRYCCASPQEIERFSLMKTRFKEQQK